MGGAESVHQHHHHHKNVRAKIQTSYNEDGVIVLSDEELHHLWEHYDGNKNDLLDRHELELLVADLVEHTVTDAGERQQIRSQIDTNGNFVDGLFAKLDLNGDGVIVFDEFKNAYHHILNHYLENH